MSAHRRRSRTWSQNRGNGSMPDAFGSIQEEGISATPYSAQIGTVRQGPLCIGLALLFVIPMLILSFTDTTIDKSVQEAHNDVRAGGAWVPVRDSSENVVQGFDPKQQQQSPHSIPDTVKDMEDANLERCLLQSIKSDTDGTVSKERLIVEAPNRVLVAVTEKETSDWILLQHAGILIPPRTKQPSLTPVEGQILHSSRHPFDLAKKMSREQLGLVSPHTSQLYASREQIQFDVEGILDGTLPSKLQDDTHWKYLGRYRNDADYGGGFTFVYFLKNAVTDKSNSVNTSRLLPDPWSRIPNQISLSTAQVRNALTAGEFGTLASALAISLALQHV
jgi:hypothetical protein